jgi:hypothetical protein
MAKHANDVKALVGSMVSGAMLRCSLSESACCCHAIDCFTEQDAVSMNIVFKVPSVGFDEVFFAVWCYL